MATLELDPVFVKALGFLRSRSKDSTEQLKALLDESLAGTNRGRFNKQDKEVSKRSGTRQKEEKAPTPCIKLAATEGSRKEAERRAEKRAGEKLKTSSSDSLDPPQSKKLRSEKRRKPVIEDDEDEEDEEDEDENEDEVEDESAGTEDSSKESMTGDSNHGDSNHGSTDADDFAVEMGLACIVCKQLEVAAGNQLVECQECHSLYHQLCHKPPASEADPNDPRLVWYCSRCTRNMKKQATKKVKNTGSTSHVAKESSSKDTEAKSDTEVLNIFKRAEPKSTANTSSSSSSSKTPYTGLASFAANLTGRSTANSKAAASSSSRPPSLSAKSGHKATPVPSPVNKNAPLSGSKSHGSTKVSSGHSGKSGPQTSTASAMKRLQQMKKKASSKR
ncbi:integrator complex subunit 12-like [Patiria miniata]|uniref:Integrator complex subunit 12 n=1 Tax=Patiria miniata TaxID=46514 RepID=A0A913ZQR8_PATMI|nr:integrator complex subunit 12-like [Patiria miniata]XP_038053480.1 integrator complex subunit 12-like [Patiria miniata]XP_038053481.1 integrator complex subunit 12-like [Patiria miniata]